jgi:hypothetical protein
LFFLSEDVLQFGNPIEHTASWSPYFGRQLGLTRMDFTFVEIDIATFTALKIQSGFRSALDSFRCLAPASSDDWQSSV